MILVQENGALKAEIELMKEKLEQTIKLLEMWKEDKSAMTCIY